VDAVTWSRSVAPTMVIYLSPLTPRTGMRLGQLESVSDVAARRLRSYILTSGSDSRNPVVRR
jgi:hypothetical protein